MGSGLECRRHERDVAISDGRHSLGQRRGDALARKSRSSKKAHQVYFDLLFKDRSCKLDEIESIEPLPGGGFVAVVRWSMGGYRRPNGVMRPPGKDRMSLVLVPRSEGLAIAHGANVPIDEEAETHNPIKR